jgi:hypothetical protein
MDSSLDLQNRVSPEHIGAQPPQVNFSNTPYLQSNVNGRTTYSDEILQKNDISNVGLFYEQGVSGLTRYGGFVYEDFLKELQGKSGAATYREMRDNDPIIGAFLYAIEHLIRQVKWDVQAAGTTDSDKEAAEFLQTCLYDMSHTWSDTISEILSFATFGWSFFETCYKIRKGQDQPTGLTRSRYNDGRVGWRKFAVRAQETLWRWRFQLDGGILGMEQIAPPDFRLRYIPIEKALLFRVKPNKNNPEGYSILRNAYTSWYAAKALRQIEAIGIEKDLIGVPVMHIPPEAFDPDGSPEARQLFQSSQKLLKNLKRHEQEGILLPSTYDEKGNLTTDIKLLASSGSSRRQFDVDKIIKRYEERMALTVMADFLLLGGGGSRAGSYALSVNKSSLFQVALMSLVENICDTFNAYAIPRLFKYNNFTNLTDYPKLTHSLIKETNITELGNYIKNLVGSNILNVQDDTELENFLRSKAELPLRSDYQNTPSIPIDDSAGNTKIPNFEKTARSLRNGGDGYPKYPSVKKSVAIYNLEDLSIEIQERIEKHINYLELFYPVSVKEVSCGQLEDDTFASTNTVNKTIKLNKNYFVEPDITKSIELATACNWHPVISEGKELESVVTHEFGHLVYKTYIKDRYENYFINLVWGSIVKYPSLAPSIYATKNPHECFAELFSLLFCGVSSEQVNLVSDILNVAKLNL